MVLHVMEQRARQNGQQDGDSEVFHASQWLMYPLHGARPGDLRDIGKSRVEGGFDLGFGLAEERGQYRQTPQRTAIVGIGFRRGNFAGSQSGVEQVIRFVRASGRSDS